MVEKEPVIKTIQDTKAKLVANLLAAQKEHDDFMSSLRSMVSDVTGERKSSGGKSTGKKRNRGPNVSQDKELQEKMQALINKEWSVEEVGEKFDVKAATVRKYTKPLKSAETK